MLIIIIITVIVILVSVGSYIVIKNNSASKNITDNTKKNCLLNSNKEEYCNTNNGVNTISYKIETKEDGGKNCIQVARDLYGGEWTLDNDKVIQTGTCMVPCEIGTLTEIPCNRTTGVKKSTVSIIKRSYNGGQTCKEITEDLYGGIWNIENDKVVKEEPCEKDCRLNLFSRSVNCNKNTGILSTTYNIINVEENGGNSCEKVATDLYGGSWTQQDNKVVQESNCNVDCEISPTFLNGECNQETGQKLVSSDILVTPKNNGVNCVQVANNRMNGSWNVQDGKVVSNFPCPVDCKISELKQDLCNISTGKRNIYVDINKNPMNGGRTCEQVAGYNNRVGNKIITGNLDCLSIMSPSNLKVIGSKTEYESIYLYRDSNLNNKLFKIYRNSNDEIKLNQAMNYYYMNLDNVVGLEIDESIPYLNVSSLYGYGQYSDANSVYFYRGNYSSPDAVTQIINNTDYSSNTDSLFKMRFYDSWQGSYSVDFYLEKVLFNSPISCNISADTEFNNSAPCEGNVKLFKYNVLNESIKNTTCEQKAAQLNSEYSNWVRQGTKVVGGKTCGCVIEFDNIYLTPTKIQLKYNINNIVGTSQECIDNAVNSIKQYSPYSDWRIITENGKQKVIGEKNIIIPASPSTNNLMFFGQTSNFSYNFVVEQNGVYRFIKFYTEGTVNYFRTHILPSGFDPYLTWRIIGIVIDKNLSVGSSKISDILNSSFQFAPSQYNGSIWLRSALQEADPFSFFMERNYDNIPENIEDVPYRVTIRYNAGNQNYNLTLKPIFVDIPKP